MLPAPSANARAKTIAIKLQGGIGNQLFQYALASHLGDSGAFEVCFLDDGFAHDPYGRHSMVQRLDPGVQLRTSSEFQGAQCRVLQEAAWPGVLQGEALRTLMEQQQVDTCLLDGYWQNPAYTSTATLEKLRHGLAALDASAAALGLAADIANAACAVAVHVRRRDYKHHGICREHYYLDSLRWLLAQVPDADILVFSDEPNYTGHFLRQAGIPHRLVATGDDLHDLRLMSACHLHLIANSTFSWWGACLAHSRQVVYPLPWSALHTPVAGFFPPQWIGLEDAVSSAIEPVRYQHALAHWSVTALAAGERPPAPAHPPESSDEKF